MKKIILAWFTLCITFGALQAATLFAVLIGDTDDFSIGECVKIDIRLMSKQARFIADSAEMDLVLFEFTGENLETELYQSTADMQVNEDDVILFYWSGHGFNENGNWPNLYLSHRGNGVNQLDITEIFYSLNPRMMLSLSDCCNSGALFQLETMKVKAKAYTRHYYEELKNHFHHLFRDYEGVIIAAGSEPGGYSFCNMYHGGHFTYNFLEELNEFGQSWESIFKRTQQGVQEMHALQVPQFMIDLKKR